MLSGPTGYVKERPVRSNIAATVLSLTAVLVAVAPAGAATVRVGDNFFSPKTLSVRQHSTVTWRFVGKNDHRITVKQGPARFSSPTMSSGKYLKHMMRKGTYKLICSIHRGSQRMTLKVT
jgi:plastocyanin